MKYRFLAIMLLALVRLTMAQTPADPSTWLVVYNTNSAESIQWGKWYAAEWGIPSANLLGVNASLDERLVDIATAESQIIRHIRNRLVGQNYIIGIVLGYRVPGVMGTGWSGYGGDSIACHLQDLTDETWNDNPHASRMNRPYSLLPAKRLTRSYMVKNHYMVARIDAPTLAIAKGMTIRAKEIWQAGSAVSSSFRVYYDYTDSNYGIWSALKAAVTLPELSTLTWAAYDSDTSASTGATVQIGWHSISQWNNGRLVDPTGTKILAYNLNSWGSTTVRSTTAEGGRYVPNALTNGWAAAIGSTEEPFSVNGPSSDTILAALMAGWTLGEAFYISNPYDDFTWNLLGDPFLRINPWSTEPIHAWADFDSNGSVDIGDYGQFASCFNGTSNPYDPNCWRIDRDGDGDIDLGEYTMFASAFNGTGNPPNQY